MSQKTISVLSEISPYYLVLGFFAIMGLYFTNFYNYLLFHSLVELFSIIVAVLIFTITWNARDNIENNYLLIMGTAYLFIGGIDLVHTLAYEGMGVFLNYGADLPTQLWISARYMEAFTLLIAPLLLYRDKIDVSYSILAYGTGFTVIMLTVFQGIFPTCYVEGVGLTLFKKASEYVISIILAFSLYFLYRYRDSFKSYVFKLLAASIVLTIGAELAFTFYVSVYGFSNLVGHFLKLASFVLIYQAVIVTGFREPFDLLFRELKEREDELKKSKKDAERERDRAQKYLENVEVMMVSINPEGNVIQANRKASEVLGYDKEELVGMNWFENFIPEEYGKEIRDVHQKIVKNDYPKYYENPVLTKSGEKRTILWHNTTLKDGEGNITGTLSSGMDITERKKAKEELKEYTQELQFVNETVIKASRMDEIDEICQFVAEKIQEKNKGVYVWILLYDRDLDLIRLRGLAGFDEDLIESMNEILGADFRDFTVKPGEMGEETSLYTSGELEKVPGGLYTLSTGKIPKEACEKLEELLGIKSVYTVGFSLGKKPHGEIIILPPNDKEIQYKSGIETIASYISELLQHRQTQEELKKSEERKDFLNTLLRQDLGSICQTVQGYLQLFEEEADIPDEKKEYLNKVVEAGRKGDEILGLTKKLEEIEQTDWIGEKDIIKVLEQVIEDISSFAGREGVKIEKTYPDTISKVEGDYSLSVLFSQILLTRIQTFECSNIRIEASEKEENVLVRIEDDGESLPEDIKSMFSGEPYTGETTGVGGVRYYMIRQIAEHNKAEIEVQDSEPDGARFDVYLQKA